MMEKWKDIPGYEGYYQASNKGRVRSLDRIVTYCDGRVREYRGKIFSGSDNQGYRRVNISAGEKGGSYGFSQLVAMAFLGHTPNESKFVVDHINGIRSDNRPENLRIVTNRENISSGYRRDRGKTSSKYVGVCWHKRRSLWCASIWKDGSRHYLGAYKEEEEAHNAYQKALMEIDSVKPR